MQVAASDTNYAALAKVQAEVIKEVADASGADNPSALVAAAGIKKYGVKKMAKLAAAGRKRAARRT